MILPACSHRKGTRSVESEASAPERTATKAATMEVAAAMEATAANDRRHRRAPKLTFGETIPSATTAKNSFRNILTRHDCCASSD